MKECKKNLEHFGRRKDLTSIRTIRRVGHYIGSMHELRPERTCEEAYMLARLYLS